MQDTNLISKVKSEYQIGRQYVNNKRIQYFDRIEKYDKQKKDKTKINIHMIANAINTLIAVSFTDGLTQKFLPTDGWIGREKADKLNYVAKFDSRTAHYQQIKYQTEFDRLFYGVGIRILQNFDEIDMQPKWISVNPLNCIFDPSPTQNGVYDGNQLKFFGTVVQTSFYDLRDAGYDKEGLYEILKVANKTSADSYLLKNAEANRGNYVQMYYQTAVDQYEGNFSLEVYYHFTWYNGKKICVLTDATQSFVLQIREIPAVLKNEQENVNRVPRPFVLNYYEPLRNDPFGKSICDRLEDKQDAKSILYNLSIIKAKKEALGGDFLVNSRIIKNRTDLTRPTTDSRYIVADVTTGENLGNAMMEVPRSQVKQDVYNWINLIEKEATLDTGIDALQQGIVGDRNITATESQTVQANANVINILRNNINSWGERAFWNLWYREYVAKFSKSDSKFIALKNNFEYSTFSLKRDDFIGSGDIHIEVGTASDIEAQDNKLLQAMQLERPQFMASQAKEVSKRFFMRQLYRLMGFDENTVMLFVDLTPYERKAKDIVDIVNLNVKLPETAFVTTDPEYLYTLWVYLQKAEDNRFKKALLDTLQQKMLESGINSSVTPALGQGQEVANQASGVQMGQAANSMQQPLTRGSNLQPNVLQNA